MDKIVLSLPTDLIYDKRKDGWTLLEDAPLVGTPILELAEFLRDSESYVNGEVMLSRAKELGNLAGQRHAERMLACASQIPESWRSFYLVFPGTVWRGGSGGRGVPYLDWGGDGWSLYWDWLGRDWYGDGRVVRLSK
ncbi:hypothetical protein HYT45_00975 [Candidatus Uhrbacteria bacterium]|nr:hypothetical protein [Candidatus Uhrbacteria bacterium]